MSLNFIWRYDKWYNKRVLIWRFTLVLIKMNYGQIGDQTGLFYTTNPVFYTSGNRFVRRTSTFGNLWFFHLSRRTTVIQDLLVRRQFSLVSDKCWCRGMDILQTLRVQIRGKNNINLWPIKFMTSSTIYIDILPIFTY